MKYLHKLKATNFSSHPPTASIKFTLVKSHKMITYPNIKYMHVCLFHVVDSLRICVGQRKVSLFSWIQWKYSASGAVRSTISVLTTQQQCHDMVAKNKNPQGLLWAESSRNYLLYKALHPPVKANMQLTLLFSLGGCHWFLHPVKLPRSQWCSWSSSVESF